MKFFWTTLGWAWQQKFKALAFVGLCLLWTLLLFPTQKLGELIESLVPKLTRYQSFVFFDRFNLSLSGTVTLENVWLSTQGLRPIEVSKMIVRPQILNLLRGQPTGYLSAVNLFGGTLDLQVSQASSNQSSLILSASGLQLEPLLEMIQAPIKIMGAIDVSVSGVVDPKFQTDPQGEVLVKSSGLTLKSSQMPTPLGPLSLPQIRFGQAQSKLLLSQGRLIIEPSQIGNATDDLSAQISGEIALVLRDQGFQMGAYRLDLDLLARPGFIQKGGLLLSLLDGYKKVEGDAQRYRLRLSALQPGDLPSISAR